MRVDLADLLKRADAVHLRHTDVEHDGGILPGGDFRQRLFRPLGGIDGEFRRETKRDRFARAVFIVDDEHR